MGCRLAYLHFPLAHTNGQDQEYVHLTMNILEMVIDTIALRY